MTSIGNSYCMFALFFQACQEWTAILQGALYFKWLMPIDSLLFEKRVSEREGAVTEDALQMCCRVQHIMLICCVRDFQEF